MRLTDEDVRRHKENKYSVECVKGKVKMSDGDIIGNLLDTIQALQQEYDELDTGHSKLFKEFCEMKQENEQLRAQNGVMRGALKQAREAIKQLSLCDCNYNCEDCQHDNKLCSVYADGVVIDKALAAIMEVGE